MHFSSYLKAQVFLRVFDADLAPAGHRIRVLEVGSKSYHAHDTYKSLCPADRYDYRGLDIEAGPNVDVVPANPFLWTEIADDSFDLCLSGQTFEHNPYFWVTFAEMARVLRPGGMAFVVAPGGGQVHRYPVDCWRFYPDSWAALAALTGMELVESYFETDDLAMSVEGGRWRDSVAIVRKPELEGEARAAFGRRLERIVALFEGEVVPIAKAREGGRWSEAYRAAAKAEGDAGLGAWFRRKRFGALARIYRGDR